MSFSLEYHSQRFSKELQRISNVLLINGGFMDNPGLYTGEMGLALFFSHYARFSQNELYSDYSFDLIEKVQNRIHQETSINYKQGLAGIGSTIEYLVQNRYFNANTDDILEEYDDHIFSFSSLPHMSIDMLLGIGYYALWRMTGNSARKPEILKNVLPQLISFMERKTQSQNWTYPTVDYLKKIIENDNNINLPDFAIIPLQLWRKKYPYGLEENTYNRFMEQISEKDFFNHRTFDLGLQNGLAGFGMALMTKFNGNDSWISLLPNDLIQKKNESLPV